MRTSYVLVKLDIGRGELQLHGVMRSWLAENLGDARQGHQRLVSGWGKLAEFAR
jgi:hypothetical protein